MEYLSEKTLWRESDEIPLSVIWRIQKILREFFVSRVGFDVPVWYLLLYWQAQNVHCWRQWRQLKSRYYTIKKLLYRLSLFLETCKIELFLVTLACFFWAFLSCEPFITVLWIKNQVFRCSMETYLKCTFLPFGSVGTPYCRLQWNPDQTYGDLYLKNIVSSGSLCPSKSSWVISR